MARLEVRFPMLTKGLFNHTGAFCFESVRNYAIAVQLNVC